MRIQEQLPMRLAVLTLLAALVAPAAARATTPEAVLILALRPLGIDRAEADVVTTQLAEAVVTTGGLRVVTAAEINALATMQKDRLQLNCADESCIAALALAAQTRFVVTGSLGAVGDDIVLSLTLVDSTTGATTGKVSRTAPGLGEIAAALPQVVAELFGREVGAAPAVRYRLPEGTQTSLAVFDLKSLGLTADTAQNLTQMLATEIKKIGGVSVISRDDITSMLQMEARKIETGCDDMSCLAEIGGALGVDKLVVGDAGKLGDSYVVSLRLIDVRAARVDSRVSETFTGRENQLLPAVRLAGRALFGVASDVPSSVAISANENEAALFFDNTSAGMLPRPALEGLAPGKHAVRVEKEDFFVWSSDVYLDPGSATTLWVELEAKPTNWPFWSLLAGTGVTAALATTFGVVAESRNDRARSLAVDGGDPAERTDAFVGARDMAKAANVTWVAAGIIAVGAGIAGLLSDWE